MAGLVWQCLFLTMTPSFTWTRLAGLFSNGKFQSSDRWPCFGDWSLELESSGCGWRQCLGGRRRKCRSVTQRRTFAFATSYWLTGRLPLPRSLSDISQFFTQSSSVHLHTLTFRPIGISKRSSLLPVGDCVSRCYKFKPLWTLLVKTRLRNAAPW